MYLYQQAIVYPARKLTAGYPMLVQVFAVSLLVIVCAEASYRLVERPFLRLKKRFETTKVADLGKATKLTEQVRGAPSSPRRSNTLICACCSALLPFNAAISFMNS